MTPVQTTPVYMTPEQTTPMTNPITMISRPCVRATTASPAPECKPLINPSHVNLSPSPHTAAQPASTQPPYAQTWPRQTCPRHTVRTTPDSPYYKSIAMTTHNQPSASHTVTRRMQETPRTAIRTTPITTAIRTTPTITTPINRPPARTTPASPTAHHSGPSDLNQEDHTRDATLKARTAAAQTPSAQAPPYQSTPRIASPAQPTSPGPAFRHSAPSTRAATYSPTPSRTVTATADTGTKNAGPCLPRVACMRETRRPTCISEPPPPLLCR